MARALQLRCFALLKPQERSSVMNSDCQDAPVTVIRGAEVQGMVCWHDKRVLRQLSSSECFPR
eukprot:3185778-Pyramimonas_sp.AAC.1